MAGRQRATSFWRWPGTLTLLEHADAPWAERTLFTHVGRWEKGAPTDTGKYKGASLRTPRWHLVSEGKKDAAATWQLFDVSADYGEKTDVSAEHADVVAAMTGDFEKWWVSVQPQLVNESAVGPKVNPFKELFWQQYGGGPER